MVSKSRLDKAGRALAHGDSVDEFELLFLEDEFDEYRKSHLQPLSETTLELQRWLGSYGKPYYIAQRLKRKPQIIRKLKRLSTRLTQLQDIGGSRIIVDNNADVDKLYSYIVETNKASNSFNIIRTTDYREKGRDDSGYRALHVIIEHNQRVIELQIRSKTQHYWSESIERTSVVYGNHLKEGEGDPSVISYFKCPSDIFYEIEAGRDPSPRLKIELDKLRVQAEDIIVHTDKAGAIGSYVNEDIIKSMIEKESASSPGLNNWIIVFDWNNGSFVTWDVVGKSPDEAIAQYVRYERDYPAELRYEVVLIGSSNVSTVRETHSHYFGIEDFDVILESLDQSIIGFSKRLDIDVGARQILGTLYRKKYVGRKAISSDTLKNHYCKAVVTFDSSLRTLVEKGLVLMANSQSPVSLDMKRMKDIERYL